MIDRELRAEWDKRINRRGGSKHGRWQEFVLRDPGAGPG